MRPGQIVLFRFPQTDLAEGKLRSALLLSQLPGDYPDWLVCMISSQQRQFVADFDEMIQVSDADFGDSGLKVSSVVRVTRLAVVDENTLVGSIGAISDERLSSIKRRLADWITSH